MGEKYTLVQPLVIYSIKKIQILLVIPSSIFLNYNLWILNEPSFLSITVMYINFENHISYHLKHSFD